MRRPRGPAVGTPIPRLADHKTCAPPAHAVSSPLWLRFRDRARLDHHADLPACQHQSRAELLAKHAHPLGPNTAPRPTQMRVPTARAIRRAFAAPLHSTSTADTLHHLHSRQCDHHVDLPLERQYRAWPTAKHAAPLRAPPPRLSPSHFATARGLTNTRTSRRANPNAAPSPSHNTRTRSQCQHGASPDQNARLDCARNSARVCAPLHSTSTANTLHHLLSPTGPPRGPPVRMPIPRLGHRKTRAPAARAATSTLSLTLRDRAQVDHRPDLPFERQGRTSPLAKHAPALRTQFPPHSRPRFGTVPRQ
ncbi:hypothetical protein SCP_1200450 [Sparassis crispa]|uniref:Uncharacterized protein n=1 Tax=Sparassis crispa TaxID=139825 RepID=A0A401H0A5_9APHY|nr:hypothetical protein SCP_1200450 [Sparassis crispa]GBE87820.1 hypothetical protein SCP_1200450 [Sparassis crispa]